MKERNAPAAIGIVNPATAYRSAMIYGRSQIDSYANYASHNDTYHDKEYIKHQNIVTKQPLISRYLFLIRYSDHIIKY